MTSFFYFNSMDLSEAEKTFRVEYKGKPFFFVISSNQIKKKKFFSGNISRCRKPKLYGMPSSQSSLVIKRK